MVAIQNQTSSLNHFYDFQFVFDKCRHFELHVSATAAFADSAVKCSRQVFKRFCDRLMNDSALGSHGKVTEGSGTGRDSATDIRVFTSMMADFAEADRDLMKPRRKPREAFVCSVSNESLSA